jgi:hypothetical protein
VRAQPSSVRLLTDLEGARRLRPGAARVDALLRQAERVETRNPQDIVRLHDVLLFLSAYPHSRLVRSRAERLLRSFARRIESLAAAGADLSLFDRPEAAGIAGTAVAMTFSYDIARWLERKFTKRIRIDWDVFGEVERLGPFLARVLPLVREEALADANVPYRAALEEAARKRRQRPLTFILRAIEALGLPQADAAALYDALSIQIWWELGRDGVSRTRMRRRTRVPIHIQDEPLGTRRDVSLPAELSARPLPFERLSRVEGEKALDLARGALAVRYRELHAFTHGDPGAVVVASAGRGVELLVNGVLAPWRHPLRAGFGLVVWKNGVPVGYGDAYGLFERLEVSFNVFPAFRDGESAFLYGRVLRFFRHHLGARVFWVDPYQVGAHNEEAVASGAFWFYRKLGFRSTDPLLEGLVQSEENRLARSSTSLTKPPLLRRFASSPLVFETAAAETGEWDRFHVGNLRSAAVAGMARTGMELGAYREAAVARVCRRLGIAEATLRDPDLRRALGGFALVLDPIPDLQEWSAADREALSEIVGAKASGSEERYLRRLQAHARLRRAILEIGARKAVRERRRHHRS